jgi:hypothetical protein
MQPANGCSMVPRKPGDHQPNNDHNAEHHTLNFHSRENLKSHTLKRLYLLLLYYAFHQFDYITKIMIVVGWH